jgi:hypothetical protein
VHPRRRRDEGVHRGRRRPYKRIPIAEVLADPFEAEIDQIRTWAHCRPEPRDVMMKRYPAFSSEIANAQTYRATTAVDVPAADRLGHGRGPRVVASADVARRRRRTARRDHPRLRRSLAKVAPPAPADQPLPWTASCGSSAAAVSSSSLREPRAHQRHAEGRARGTEAGQPADDLRPARRPGEQEPPPRAASEGRRVRRPSAAVHRAEPGLRAGPSPSSRC